MHAIRRHPNDQADVHKEKSLMLHSLMAASWMSAHNWEKIQIIKVHKGNSVTPCLLTAFSSMHAFRRHGLSLRYPSWIYIQKTSKHSHMAALRKRAQRASKIAWIEFMESSGCTDKHSRNCLPDEYGGKHITLTIQRVWLKVSFYNSM